MLAMSTVLRCEEPFKTIFGYATLFGEDGRPMHKSWGNAIDFDEAAERMGVDVMRWMFVTARPDDNILFGWHGADTARQKLLILWNVYAFFVRYARLAGWTPADDGPSVGAPAVDMPAVDARAPLDRWILSRAAGLASRAEERLRDYDSLGAARAISSFIDDLSTWYLRNSRERFRRNEDAGDRAAAFATLHAALVAAARVMAPTLPFLSESIYRNLAAAQDSSAPESVHLSGWPSADFAPYRDEALEAAVATARRAVDLARTLRGQAGLKVRQPLARMWLALPGGSLAEQDALLALIAQEVNVKSVELIGDESELVERRVKPLLPKIGKKLGSRIPEVMAAARENRFEIHADGSVTLGGVTLRAGRGRDPRDAAARDCGRPRRGPRRRHRHRADRRAAGRGRRARAPAGDPGPAQGRRPRAGRSDRRLDRRPDACGGGASWGGRRRDAGRRDRPGSGPGRADDGRGGARRGSCAGCLAPSSARR